MLERRTLSRVIATAAIASLIATGCGADDRNEVSTSAKSGVTTAPSETTVPSDTADRSSDLTSPESSSPTIPFEEPTTLSESEGTLPYNVLTSPQEFDETIGRLTPKDPEKPALASLCVSYYDAFAGYRLLDQFADTDQAGLARGLAMRRIRSALTESRRATAAEIDRAAQSEPVVADDSEAVVALREMLSEVAHRAEEEVQKGNRAGDEAAVEVTAALLDLPDDQRSALDKLGDSDSGCVERRAD